MIFRQFKYPYLSGCIENTKKLKRFSIRFTTRTDDLFLHLYTFERLHYATFFMDFKNFPYAFDLTIKFSNYERKNQNPKNHTFSTLSCPKIVLHKSVKLHERLVR